MGCHCLLQKQVVEAYNKDYLYQYTDEIYQVIVPTFHLIEPMKNNCPYQQRKALFFFPPGITSTRTPQQAVEAQ